VLPEIRDYNQRGFPVTTKVIETKSAGTVHASAKTRLTSVVMRIRIRDPDYHQNLIICIGPLLTFPENIMQIHSEVLAQSC